MIQGIVKEISSAVDLLPSDKENRWYHRLSELCQSLVYLLMKTNKPILALSLFRKCVQKTQSHPEEFTCLHSYLAHMSLKAKCYHHNLKYFKIDFIDIKCANTVQREDTSVKIEEQKAAEEAQDAANSATGGTGAAKGAKRGKAAQPAPVTALQAPSGGFSMQFLNEQTLGNKEIQQRQLKNRYFYTEYTANHLTSYYYYLG